MSHLLEFGMTGPLNESISCFLKRVDPWVLVPSPSEDYTSSRSEDYTSSPSEDYTSSPSEDYTSSPSEGYTPSPLEGYASSPLEGYMHTLRGLRVLIFSVLHIYTLREFKVLCP